MICNIIITRASLGKNIQTLNAFINLSYLCSVITTSQILMPQMGKLETNFNLNFERTNHGILVL